MSRGLAVLAAALLMGAVVAGMLLAAKRRVLRPLDQRGFTMNFSFGGVKGSGKVIDVERPVGSFTALRAGGAVDLVVTPDNSPLKIRVEDNLAPLLETKVRGGALEIGWTQSVSPTQPVKITVGAQKLSGLQLSGAVRGAAKGVSSPSFELELSGASHVELAGHVSALKARLSGSSEADLDMGSDLNVDAECSGASGLKLAGSGSLLRAGLNGASRMEVPGEFKKVEVSVSGASWISANATESMTGDASGASRVRTKTRPGVFDVHTSGASSAKAEA